MKLNFLVFSALACAPYSGLLLAVPNFTPLNDYELIGSYRVAEATSRASKGTDRACAFPLDDTRWNHSGTSNIYELAAGNSTDGHLLRRGDYMSDGIYRNGWEISLALTTQSVEAKSNACGGFSLAATIP